MKQLASKKLATLCALIGAGISCIGVAQAESDLTGHNAGPVTDAASRFEAADGADIPSEMSLPQYDNDQFEKLLLALQERETPPPTLPRDDGLRSHGTILLKQETDGRKPAGLAAAESASQDNAADAINATLKALSERRSEQFLLDTQDATEPLVALEHGDELGTASNASVPVAQSKVLPTNLTHLMQAERAAEVKEKSSEQGPAHEWLAVSNNSLDGMRGGFDNGAGLKVSFGIERAVYINGNLTTSISFNIPDVSKLAAIQAKVAAGQAKVAPGQARHSADQAGVIAAQAGVTPTQAGVAPTQAGVTPTQAGVTPTQAGVATTQAGVTPTQAGVTPTQAGVTPTQAGVTPTQAGVATTQAGVVAAQAGLSEQVSEQAKISSVAGTVSLVQNGPGNTFQPGPLPQTVAATIIQNTLNNQSIKSLTVINTTVNSLSVLKGLNAQTSLRDALGNSLGIR